MDVFWAVALAVGGLYLGWTVVSFIRTPRRARPAIDPAVRGEIEQTMGWWDSEFRKLEAKADPEARVYRASNRVYASHGRDRERHRNYHNVPPTEAEEWGAVIEGRILAVTEGDYK